EHVGHQLGLRPHALADLCAAPEAEREADVDVPVLVGGHHFADFMSALRIIGPASMEAWISSPVRSRKPVLMKTTRSRASAMHAARFTVVRRSSSMMPTLRVFAGSPSSDSIRPNSSVVNATSSGPCCFGLTM